MLTQGFGYSISTERLDDLDQYLLRLVRESQEELRFLDLGCGDGRVAQEAALLGARTTGVDICLPKMTNFQHPELSWITVTAEEYSKYLLLASLKFDIICCQRMLHYLPYSEAEVLLLMLSQCLTEIGSFGISVSGMSSELSERYIDFQRDPLNRFSKLSKKMQDKHQIYHPVCLYSQVEFEQLLLKTGFLIRESWVSDFGNVKIIANRNLAFSKTLVS